jgi:DNA primase
MPEEQAAAEEHDHLRSLLEEGVTFFRHMLLNNPQGKSAFDYLRQKRGLTDETIEGFGLGYAPNAWDVLTQHFRTRGYSEEDLLACGLVTAGDSGSIYDRFRHRITFPIRDGRGRMAGFGGRVLNPDDTPKFLNTPQTDIFDKGHLLYGLDRARKAIRELGQAVLVEGYLDVIALHQAGFANVVSPMGTALTEYQLRQLKRMAGKIILALDADVAGAQATLRGLQLARQTLERTDEVAFDARGLLRHESRMQADIRVTLLPEGMDPDELVQRDPEEWQHIVDNARPIVIHVMETLAANRDLDDPKVKREIAREILPLIEDVPSPVERDAYQQRLARLLRVDEIALLKEQPVRPRSRPVERRRTTINIDKKKESAPVQDVAPVTQSGYLLETHCLGVLLRRPDMLYKVDRQLQISGLSRLSAEDFQHTDHQAVFRLLQESLDQDEAEPMQYVLNNFSLSMMDVADDLLARTEHLDPNDHRVLGDLLRGLIDLRLRNLRQSIEYTRFMMEEAQAQGDLMAVQHQQNMVQYNKALDNLNRARYKYTNRAASTG